MQAFNYDTRAEFRIQNSGDRSQGDQRREHFGNSGFCLLTTFLTE